MFQLISYLVIFYPKEKKTQEKGMESILKADLPFLNGRGEN